MSLGGINNEDEGKGGPNGEKLYHVKATDDFDAHAVQVCGRILLYIAQTDTGVGSHEETPVVATK